MFLYEAGILWLGDGAARNAADVLIDQGLLAFGRVAALAVNLLVLGVIATVALRTARRKATPIGLFLPALGEGALYACLMLPVLMAVRIAAGTAHGHVAGATLALGAGFYEELVFRLAAVGGLSLFLMRLRVPPWAATLAPLLLSAAAFSWFHHVGPGAEPFTAHVFTVRAVAGVLLGAVYILRGFGIACYTHVIYDLICLFTR